MKFTSALTITTLVSVLSTTHALPLSLKSNTLKPSSEHTHLRRASTISDVTAHDFSSDFSSPHDDILEGLGTAFEPGNSIKQLFNMVRRQLGSTDRTSNAASSTGGSTTSDAPSAGISSEENTAPSSDTTHGVTQLMGGSLTSASTAGFGFEPGNAIPNAKTVKTLKE
jgi:hypothetical protein